MDLNGVPNSLVLCPTAATDSVTPGDNVIAHAAVPISVEFARCNTNGVQFNHDFGSWMIWKANEQVRSVDVLSGFGGVKACREKFGVGNYDVYLYD